MILAIPWQTSNTNIFCYKTLQVINFEIKYKNFNLYVKYAWAPGIYKKRNLLTITNAKSVLKFLGEIITNSGCTQPADGKKLFYDLLPVQYTKLTHYLRKFLNFLTGIAVQNCEGIIICTYTYQYVNTLCMLTSCFEHNVIFGQSKMFVSLLFYFPLA